MYWEISIEKYVSKQMDDFECRHGAQTQELYIIKSFFYLEWILKNLSTTLHSQFNNHALPVTPFKPMHLFEFLTRFIYLKMCKYIYLKNSRVES